MKIRFLGTAAAEGVPALFCECDHCRYAWQAKGKEIRSRAGSIVDEVLKLDFGPDSFSQMLDSGLHFSKVKAMLITHTHDDHFDHYQIAYRRNGYAHLPEGEQKMTIYGNAHVVEVMKRHDCEWIDLKEMKPFEPVEIEGYTVTALQAVHYRDHGDGKAFPVTFEGETVYRTEDALFYLIEKDGKSLLYAHDTDEFTPEDMEFLKGRKIDLISLDCTNGYLNAEYIGHMGANDNLRMKEKLLAIGAADEHTKFVANHFSHNGLVPHEELEKLLPGFTVAYDGLEMEV